MTPRLHIAWLIARFFQMIAVMEMAGLAGAVYCAVRGALS